VVLYKPRWGAFYETSLEEHLRERGASTLVFCGCNFPNCPRTSIYEASERDFRVVLAADAISGLYERGREELTNIGVGLMETAEVVASVGETAPVGELSSGAVAARVRRVGPGGLGAELDQLGVAIGLDVAEGLRALVEDDVELALLDPLIEPSTPEDEPAKPVHEALVRGADEVVPVVIDVLAQRGAGLADLAVDGQLQQILQLVLVESLADEVELDRGLFNSLGEVALVEREAELPVLEHVVRARFVVSSASGLVLHWKRCSVKPSLSFSADPHHPAKTDGGIFTYAAVPRHSSPKCERPFAP
jgi:hypothetical protein